MRRSCIIAGWPIGFSVTETREGGEQAGDWMDMASFWVRQGRVAQGKKSVILYVWIIPKAVYVRLVYVVVLRSAGIPVRRGTD